MVCMIEFIGMGEEQQKSGVAIERFVDAAIL